ncbi:right-handed parallel beta-helix repeat-containing protein [Chitinophagaceae bacterium 26-R-25]|nr:right-handed parallel beta-helix repeat-containing protein [Chitinophagaceae bacterium 26-R-25]
MKNFFTALFACSSLIAFAQNKSANSKPVKYHEYHVSVNGNDNNDGSAMKPLKSIMAAANKAMPGDVVTVHAGTYRESIVPPRGGNSDKERITYQAAKGEQVTIKGSEVVKGWQKQDHDTWMVKLPNSFFGSFNPYKERIHGDWFAPKPKDRVYLRGAVYLNDKWLMEAEKKEEVLNADADEKNPLWCATVEGDSTTIYAQFKNADPNKELAEINVRQTVFYPAVPFINFLTVRGFTMEQAATNWAPPTAEQQGLIGTNWSKGWIIENNTIRYSKCSGIALGKHGDEHDNKKGTTEEYVETIKRALAFGWNKGTIGGHIVRNNTISDCEQTGIVGSMGCSFSIVEGNTIHDIFIKHLYEGAEQAGIKFHGAVDVQIRNNHIYRSGYWGIWLDWMAQGAQIKNNLMHDNNEDVFCEVDHGPILISNNILLSKVSLYVNSSGLAVVHNLIGGKLKVGFYDGRLTPYHKPHSTFVVDLHDNPGGDVQFVNNLFVDSADVSKYAKTYLPVSFDGNVYTKGTVRAISNDPLKFNEKGKYKEQAAVEQNALVKNDFDVALRLVIENVGVYLEINLDKKWLTEQNRQLVTTQTLKPAIVPNLPFENSDGSVLKIDADYLGNKRNAVNPSPGPFEILKTGKQTIKVWTK